MSFVLSRRLFGTMSSSSLPVQSSVSRPAQSASSYGSAVSLLFCKSSNRSTGNSPRLAGSSCITFSLATIVCSALHLAMSLGRVSSRFPLHLRILSRVQRPSDAGSDVRRFDAQLNSLCAHVRASVKCERRRWHRGFGSSNHTSTKTTPRCLLALSEFR